MNNQEKINWFKKIGIPVLDKTSDAALGLRVLAESKRPSILQMEHTWVTRVKLPIYVDELKLPGIYLEDCNRTLTIWDAEGLVCSHNMANPDCRVEAIRDVQIYYTKGSETLRTLYAYEQR